MKVHLNVTLDVEPCEEKDANLPPEEVTASVREAIENAIRYAQGEGHAHPLSAVVSVLLNSVAVEPVLSDLDLLEALLALTEPFKDQMSRDDRISWSAVSALAADRRARKDGDLVSP